jgi:nanoRNase/pAp phosphatase (c-di-AMP/oligoRNAs hydrolase)
LAQNSGIVMDLVMELTPFQQIADYIDRSRKILIALPAHVTTDRICSAYALHLILQKLGKETALASAGEVKGLALDFVPELPPVQTSVGNSNSMVIRVNTSETELEELSYKSEAGELKIFLKPKQGQFTASDVTTGSSEEPFDLIVILGAQSLEDLNGLYHSDPDLFFNTPKINIDLDGSNEYFGTVNLIDVTAGALTEIVAQVIASLESAVTDETVATSLLAGIIANTHSFQDAVTTPKTLTTASQLIAQGAKQQDIVKFLYKTKDFALLKLWGRALARIKTLAESSLLYSVLTKSDFEKTGQSIEQLPQVLQELLENINGYQVVVLVAELEAGARILLAGLPHTNFRDIAKKLGGLNLATVPAHGLYQAVSVDLASIPMAEAEQKLVDAAK